MYTNYVKEQFDSLVDEVKDTLTKEIKKHEKVDSGIKSSVDEQEQIKSIVVFLGQVLLKDLPIQSRYKIMDNFNNPIHLYSDFASIFALNVQLNRLKFAMSINITVESNRVQMDSIIPHEFQVSSTTVDLPASPLQVINTVIFGVSGIQKETQNNHPLWTELTSSDNAQTVQGNDVNNELQGLVEEAKNNINSTIKKATVAQLSTDLENMYKGGKNSRKL